MRPVTLVSLAFELQGPSPRNRAPDDTLVDTQPDCLAIAEPMPLNQAPPI